MLVVAAVLGLWVGVYLWLQQREPAARIDAAVAAGDAIAAEGRAEPGTGEAEDGHYLPHASVWPFAIGVGAATLANGLVLGLWVIVPGAVLLVVGIAGFVRQTRHRDGPAPAVCADSTDVLVVGARPTGLPLAAVLTGRGARFRT